MQGNEARCIKYLSHKAEGRKLGTWVSIQHSTKGTLTTHSMCEGMKHDRVWGQEDELFIQGLLRTDQAYIRGKVTVSGSHCPCENKEKKSARKGKRP